MSILLPDAGAISILGHPSALQAKDRIGYLPPMELMAGKLLGAVAISLLMIGLYLGLGLVALLVLLDVRPARCSACSIPG